jgi:hypothetical protein
VPRTGLWVGRRVLAWAKPDMALGMALSLFFDTHAATWDDKPLRDAGIVPRPVSEFITASVGRSRPRTVTVPSPTPGPVARVGSARGPETRPRRRTAPGPGR